MKKSLGCLAIAALCTMPAPAAAGDLRLSISNGRVTIVAQDVTLKQILDEWGRVGQTIVVGADKLAGPPVTLELRDVAEGRALETLLRSASGYIVKPRVGTAGASAFDRILIMPMSRAPAVSAVPQPFAGRPQPQPQVPMPNVVDDDMENPSPIMPPGAVPPGPQQYPGMPPPYPASPPMQPGQVQQPQMTSPTPGQLPAPPNVPGNPYQMMVPPPARPPNVPGSQPPPGGRVGGPGGNNQGEGGQGEGGA
jgi:hypothetical protein